jgi:hypothetical protein
MDTVLYLASLAKRPDAPLGRTVWPIVQYLSAALMVLVSLALLLRLACGA